MNGVNKTPRHCRPRQSRRHRMPARPFCNRLLSIVLAVLACTVSTSVSANSTGTLTRYAMALQLSEVTLPRPWLSNFNFATTPSNIRYADGATIMQRPQVVSSYYDQSVQYDVARFYKPRRPQLQMMMHYAARQAGEIFSLGLDSGYSSRKIHVQPALHFGYTRAFKVAENTRISAGIGGWLGGKISEQPCRDSYEREYYCPTLTAWSDYRPPRHRLNRYASLVVHRAF